MKPKNRIEIEDKIEFDLGVDVYLIKQGKIIDVKNAAGLNEAWEIAREYCDGYCFPVYPSTTISCS